MPNETRSRETHQAASLLAASIAAVLALAAFALAATPARASLPLPVNVPNGVLATTSTILSYTIDLGTLPTRPLLLVEVTPDAAHSAMQLEIEVTNWQNTPGAPGACPGPGDSYFSPSGPGVATLSVSLLTCDPRPDAFDGGEVTVRITAVNFGGARHRRSSRFRSAA